MNPFAAYDSLYIVQDLCQRRRSTTAGEIHLFSYLACLLTLARDKSPSDWGYSYAGTEFGSPFSESLQTATEKLIEIGYLLADQECIAITPVGIEELRNWGSMGINSARNEFLDGACSTLLTLPPGYIRNAVAQDPELTSAVAASAGRPLLQGTTLDDYREAFLHISEFAGKGMADLMIPAVLWLKYLADAANERAAHEG